MKKLITTIIAAMISLPVVGLTSTAQAAPDTGCAEYGPYYAGSRFSDSAGSQSIEFTVAQGFTLQSAHVTVTNLNDDFHNASLALNGVSYPIERSGQGSTYSFTAAMSGGLGSVVLSSTDGWSLDFSIVFTKCSTTAPTTTTTAPTTTTPQVTTTTASVLPTTTTPTTTAVTTTTTVTPTLPATGADRRPLAWMCVIAMFIIGVGMLMARRSNNA